MSILRLSQIAVKEVNMRNAEARFDEDCRQRRVSSARFKVVLDTLIDGEIEELQLSETNI